METYPTPVVKPLFKVTQVIWYVFWIVEVILLFRFALKLLAANPAAPFTQFIYSVSYPLVSPFLAIVPSPASGGNVLEWSTIIALAVYWVVAWGLVSLLVMAKPVSTLEAHERLREQDV